jgi:hypothetical protein
MPRGFRASIPVAKRVEEASTNREEPIAQKDGRRGPIFIGRIEYEFLCDEISFFRCEIADIRRDDREDMFLANQHIDKLEYRFNKQEVMLKAILEQLLQASGASSSTPHRGSSEWLHSLAEDVKLSAHGRHPTAYPLRFCLFFNFLLLLFFISFFLFSSITLVLCFSGTKLHFKFRGVL